MTIQNMYSFRKKYLQPIFFMKLHNTLTKYFYFISCEIVIAMDFRNLNLPLVDDK